MRFRTSSWEKGRSLMENGQREKKHCTAIVLAAGQGKRMGTSVQKQYIQLDRPSFIYAEDYEAMKKERGFYLDLAEIPVPAAFSNEEMIKNILEFSEEEYERRRAPFMKRMQYFDDGHASDAVVDYIVERT